MHACGCGCGCVCLLAWMSISGDVVTGHATRRICGQDPGNITTTSHENLGIREALVHVKIGERSTVTVQSDMGKSYLLQDGETRSAQSLAVPSPCLHDLVWNSNEKDQIVLMRIDDSDSPGVRRWTLLSRKARPYTGYRVENAYLVAVLDHLGVIVEQCGWRRREYHLGPCLRLYGEK